MLEKINSSEDVKKLNIQEKKQLAEEIRKYILEIVSKNGGHLASNLGVVELTIALHSVFNMPEDKIVWDVGHQSYVHKILTGRKEELKTLRQFGGIAGFPKTSESETDCFNTGHSSTSISAAMGMAKARDIKNENNSVVAVIGDGSLTGGMALEALNHVGSSKTKMIVILNDNEMSISKNIGGVNKFLSKLRARKNYTRSNKTGKKIAEKLPIIGKPIIKIIQKTKNSIKQLVIPKMFFEDIGFKYFGPVDGNRIEDLEFLLKRAKDIDGPILIHVLTKKGKGYKPAEENPDKFHATGSFDLDTGKPKSKKSKDYSKAFGDKLVDLAEKNKNIVAITASMKDGTGLTEFAEKYPERFFDVGIAEQHALTFAAGLAKEGMIPFVPIYSSFYQRAYDQVIHDICLQNLPVIMCVDRAGIVGQDGETHQGIYDLAFFKVIPNITIMAPKDFKELEDMMDIAVTLNKPVVIRYPRGGESNIKLNKNTNIEYGKSELLKEGNDVTIIGIGKTVSKAMEISKKLEKEDVNAEVINARFLKPLDSKVILESISKTKNVITIEDGTLVGGLGSSVKELIIDEGLEDIKIKTYGYPDVFVKHGTVDELEKQYGLDTESIANYIVDNIKKEEEECLKI
ncbi:MAG: 1-deoxy-D-xylulose-5-phosphate synthase [Clostridia bacterium]|nr:1-deoxy-D-xylulose-5-phosphate synthase [Clostridia bacterium]